MAMIQTNGTGSVQSRGQFWRDELENSKILLQAINQAIYDLTVTGITEYTIDTGQNRQSVKRADIPVLITRRDALLCQIQVLESYLKIGGSRASQIVPGF